MKTRKLNIFFIGALALSIIGGIAYGQLVPREAFLKDMDAAELLQIMATEKGAHSRIEKITECAEGGELPDWIVEFKNPSAERIVRNFNMDQRNEAIQRVAEYRIRKFNMQPDDSGASVLIRSIFGMNR